MSKGSEGVPNGSQPGASAVNDGIMTGKTALSGGGGAVTGGGGEIITTATDIQSPGFKELVAGMNALKQSVASQLEIQPSNDAPSSKQVSSQGGNQSMDKPDSSGVKVRYVMKAQFAVALETSWQVCKGFTLEGIVLQMAAQMTDEKNSAALSVRLEAFAKIGDYEFTVSAEIPNVQSGQDLDVVFRLTIRLPAAPEDVSKALQSVTGGSQQHNPSALVDDSLQNILRRDRMQAVLQLRVTKPAGQSGFRFNSLVFRFYGKINWTPKLKGSEIAFGLINGEFILVLAKDVYDNNATLVITARLYGTFMIGQTAVRAAVGFSRDRLTENRIQFELRVLPNVVSATQFLEELPSNTEKKGDIFKSSTLTSLELPQGLQALAKDLSQPDLLLQLAASYSLTKSELEYLQFNVFARESSIFTLGFINDAQLRDLVLQVEIKTWSVVLSGTLLVGKFAVSAQIQFIKGKGLMIKGTLAPNSGCSLATLARMEIFNEKDKRESMNIAKEAKRVNTGGDPPIDLSTGVRTRGTQLSFEMLILYNKDEKPDFSSKERPVTGDASQSNLDTNVSKELNLENKQLEKQDGGKEVKPKDDKTKASYQVQLLRLLSHFDLGWQIIQDKVIFENLGICFDVSNPREESKRKIAGLLYATWRLSKVDLFVYILGKKNQQDNTFWAGLSVKKSSKDFSNKALDIINDPKFAGEMESDSKTTLPVKLPSDLKAKPEDQKVSEGLELDGRLMACFSKNKKEDKSYVLEGVSLYVDLESPFTISDYKLVGSLFLDLRIKYPMVREKRDFSCYLKGGLVFENGLYFSIEADIPMNNKKILEEKKPTREETELQDKVESTMKKLKIGSSTRKTKVERYLDKVKIDDEDMIFLVKVGKSEPGAPTDETNYESRVSTIGDNTKTEQGTSFKSLLSSSYDKTSNNGKSTEDAIKEMVPEGNPLLRDTYQSSTQFAAVMVLRRIITGDKSERKLKALAATLTSTERWDIITDKLWIQDVGLSVIVEWDDKKHKSISGVIQGTIVLNSVVALAAQAAYSQEILTVTAVTKMNLTTLFESMDTDASEKPDLAVAIEDQTANLVIGVEAQFKKVKLQNYRIDVLTTPDFKIIGGLTLQALWFNIKHDRSKTARTTEMVLGGKLLLSNSVTLEIEGMSSKDKIQVTWAAQKESPARIAKGLVTGGFDSVDEDKNKPELPAKMGFSDWDKEEKGDVATSGEITFVKEGSTRQFDAANLKVSLIKSTAEDAWMLIDDYIMLKKFVLLVRIKTEKNKKRTLGIGLKAEFYLKERGAKDWPTGFDALEMIATKSDLKITLTPKPGRTIGDIIWCVTSGFLNVPSDFDLPAFPIFELTLNWKTKEAILSGFFSSDKKPWKIPYIEYVAKINEPQIQGTIKRQGNTSTRVSIAGKLSFLNDLIELDAEYVLLKGPLLIEGHDVKKYYDMIKNIWDKVKKGLDYFRSLGRMVGNAASAVVEGVASAAGAAVAAGSAAIGTAIGELVGALAVGGEFLAGVGGFILGGLLGGAAWLAAKGSMISLLKELCTGTEHDVEVIIGGFLDGVSPHENEDAKGNKGDQPRGGPIRGGDGRGIAVVPRGSEKLLKRFSVDKESFIELSGSGTCAGLENELTEFFLEYKYRRGALARVTRIVNANSSFQFAGTAHFTVEYQNKSTLPVVATSRSAPISKVFEGTTAIVVGKRYRIPWQRPAKTSTDAYIVGLNATKVGEQPQLDRKKEWKIQLKSTVEECFAPEKSILDVPAILGLGADIVGFIFSLDSDDNLRQGIDDRSKIGIQIEPSVPIQLSLLRNGCAIWASTPLQEGNYKVTVTILDKKLEKQTKVLPITTFDNLVVFGSGMVSGKAGQPNVAITVVDRYNITSETDHLVALVVKDGAKEQVVLSASETAETTVTYSGSYNRPSAGEYLVQILVNEKDVAASPYKLISSETNVAISWKKWSVTVPRSRISVDDTQTMTVNLYDQTGSSRRLAEDPLRGWQLQATPVDEDDNEVKSVSRLTLGKLELLEESDLARYRVRGITISKIGRYMLSLLGPQNEGGQPGEQAFESDGAKFVTITTQRILTSFIVSGDGLQTGWEKSNTNVSFQGVDQYSRELSLKGAKTEWILIGADGKMVLARGSVSYEQGYFTYVRPEVKNEGTSETYFLGIILRTPDRIVEALGSPFAIRTESYFDELDFTEKSFWYKDRFIPNQLSWATLHIRDKYAVMVRTSPLLFLVESPDYHVKSVVAKSDGTYRVSYISATTAVDFKYNLNGTSVTDKSLPSVAQPLWNPVEFSTVSPLSLLSANEERIVARYTSKQPIQIDDFSAIIYRTDASTSVLCAFAKITADPDHANTYCVRATLNQKGTFNLQPAYRGLPLTADAKSHRIQIIIEFDSYLFSNGDEKLLTPSERLWATTSSNVRTYINNFHMGAPTGNLRITIPFNFLPTSTTQIDPLLDLWPTKLTFTIIPVNGEYSGDGGNENAPQLPADNEADWRLSRLLVQYTATTASTTASPTISTTISATPRKLVYGTYPEMPSKDVIVPLLPDERIVRVRVVMPPEEDRVAGVVLETNKRGKYEIPQGCGYEEREGEYESKRPDWCAGCKGFWGGTGEGGGIVRLGVIWGK